MFSSSYDVDHYRTPTVCNPTCSIKVCLNCKRPTCILDLCDPASEEPQNAYLPEYIRAGEALRKARKEANMTRQEFAEKCGYTVKIVDRWEHGETEIPRDAKEIIKELFPKIGGVLNDKADSKNP